MGTVKKSPAFIALLLLAVSLSGCSLRSDGNTQVGEKPPSQTQTPNQSEPPKQSPPSSSQPGQGEQPAKPTDDGAIRGWNTSSGKSLAELKLKNDAYEITHIQPLTAGSGFQIKGKLRAFEAVGAAVLKGPDGKEVVQPATGKAEIVIRASQGAPKWGDFTVEVKYPESLKGKVGTLEFYVHSAKDGSRQNILPVKIELE